jgi:hypothetical protein
MAQGAVVAADALYHAACNGKVPRQEHWSSHAGARIRRLDYRGAGGALCSALSGPL